MKRLVYSPSIHAWVKTDTGVFDLTPYITGFMVDRRVNQVSQAKIEFRNPKIADSNHPNKDRFMFTQHPIERGGKTSYEPMFHPMDPIIITMSRLKGRPIQVFTGYCDTTPYVQMYPGTATLTASCTLKRLMYTFWDPGLPFIRDFMAENGWAISPNGTAFNQAPSNTGNLNDSSIGYLLYKLLEEVGGWNKKNIYIQEMPGRKIQQLVANLYKDIEKEEASSIKEFHDFLTSIFSASSYGSAGGTGGPSTGGANNYTTFPPGQGKLVGASYYAVADSGGAFAGGGTKTPDGTIPSSTPPPYGGVNGGMWYAELSNVANGNNSDWSALGNLPHGTPLRITYNGKSVIARKADVGAGGAAVKGKLRAIDLWINTAEALGFTGAGVDVVTVERLTEQMVKDIRAGKK